MVASVDSSPRLLSAASAAAVGDFSPVRRPRTSLAIRLSLPTNPAVVGTMAVFTQSHARRLARSYVRRVHDGALTLAGADARVCRPDAVECAAVAVQRMVHQSVVADDPLIEHAGVHDSMSASATLCVRCGAPIGGGDGDAAGSGKGFAGASSAVVRSSGKPTRSDAATTSDASPSKLKSRSQG